MTRRGPEGAFSIRLLDALDAAPHFPNPLRTHPEQPMTVDITFRIVADADPMIRQLRRLHHELNTLRRNRRHLDRQLDRAVKRGRGPQPAVGWRHRKGQATR